MKQKDSDNAVRKKGGKTVKNDHILDYWREFRGNSVDGEH